MIDSPYFHVVFTLPHELNSLIFCNQNLLYGLLHKCTAETLLELSSNPKHLGAVPGIIQVLHTWSQELLYHVHMHCIISGGVLTPDDKIRKSKGTFFLPVYIQRNYNAGKLNFFESCKELGNTYEWKAFRDRLYDKEWCPYIKETFNGFGNAIEYLGRYTHRIAISNSRIRSVSESHTTFSARGKLPGEPRRTITLSNEEFIRRFLLHVLPAGFQKIRYYGFLNNRTKKEKLERIFKLQGFQKFKSRFTGMTMAELIEAVWNVNIHVCKECGCINMKPFGRTRVPVT